MRKIPVEEAVGQTLCHDMTAILENGFKGVRFARGHVVRGEDIPVLLDMGKSHLFVWDPDADEVHEEDAAVAVAEVAAGPGVGTGKPSEGKVLFTATRDGLYIVNRQALDAVNAVEDYTLVSRPSMTPVSAGERLGGIRIVPLVTARQNVERAVAAAAQGAPVLRVLPYRPLKTGIIITGSEVFYGRIQDRFEPVMREKLARFGADILGAVKVPDVLHQIRQAIDGFMRQGAELILLSGGMSVDPDDLTPTAIRRTGARVVTHGAPTQPGNMLMLAYLGDTALMGVPGGSLHSKVTSVDIILPRIFAGLPVDTADIRRLGSAGFCMGCRECHYPICYFGFV